MKNIINSIISLKEIRKVPQFLFYGPIFNDTEMIVRKAIIEFSNNNPKISEIDVIIESPGGLPDSAYRIIRTFRNNFKNVNIIIPWWAKSASMFLALGGSQIIMDEYGEFGPLDVQIGKPKDYGPEMESESALIDEFSLKEIETECKQYSESFYLQLFKSEDITIHKADLMKQVLEHSSKLFEPLMNKLDPYKLGDKKRKLEIGQEYAYRILKQWHSNQNRDENILGFIHFLVYDCPDHGFVIDCNIMSKFLDFVHTADYFSADYKKGLTNLSINLMEASGLLPSYFNFIETNKSETKDQDAIKEPVSEEISESQLIVTKN